MNTWLSRNIQLFILILSLCSCAAAQKIKKTGIIAAEVTDPTGAVVPGAQVKFVATVGPMTKTLATDGEGKVSVELPPGSYDIIAIEPGFRPSTRRIIVNAGESQRVALALELGRCPPEVCQEAAQVTEPTPAPISDPPISSDPSVPASSTRRKGPQDKPVSANAEQQQKFENAIAPYVKKAQESLPEAKKKYVASLPKDEIFYVTIRLFDASKRYEQVFVVVTSWSGETIQGILDSDLVMIQNHSKGEAVTCHDSEVLDWTISKPDGTEEGNFVGKFLDSYKP